MLVMPVDDHDCIDGVGIPPLLLHKHKPDKNGERKDQGGLGSAAVLHSRELSQPYFSAFCDRQYQVWYSQYHR